VDYTLEILKYIGKFHPLVLHLPIGSLLMTFFLLLISKFQNIHLNKAIRIGVDFSFAGALLASLLGYLLSLNNDYDFNTLKFHFWAGVITLILSLGLTILHRLKGRENLFFWGYILTLIALIVTGHKGGQITHGDDYLSAAKLFETPKFIFEKDSIDYYNDVVNVIFEDKCVSCHNANKSKSDLRLDDYNLVLKGGERGSLFNTQNPKEGRLLKYINLPKEDKLHMPPKNKSQLTEKEKWLLADWVTSGAYLEQGQTNLAKNETFKTNILSFLGADEKVKPAKGSDLQKLITLGFRVKPNALEDNLLKLKFMKSRLADDHVNTLTKVKNQLIELDVSGTNFDNNMAKVLMDFPRLRVLRMDQTKISDIALGYLVNSNLDILNLCHTAVTYQGVQKLLLNAAPKSIYAWNTLIEKNQQKQLASISPSLINFGTFDLFKEKLSLSQPEIINSNHIFNDSLSILFKETVVKNSDIHFTLDGSEPNKNDPIYTGPISINKSTQLKAKSIKKGWSDSKVFEVMLFKNNHHVVDFQVNNELKRSFSISHHVNFTFENNQSVLFDGKKGKKVYRGTSIEVAKTWLGVVEQDLDIEVELNNSDEINYVTLSMLENLDMRSIFPKKIEVYGKSMKGKYELLSDLVIPVQDSPDERISYFKDFTLPVDFNGYKEIKVVALNHMKFPNAPVYQKWKSKKSWVFADELIFW
tara:strand:+ start:7049 stop:9145 length:2097 start_codon:yes stop_codon:yes gene_type:complete